VEKKPYNTSYIFGTIHIIEKEHFFLPEAFEKSMSEVSRLVFEIDMKDMTDISQQMGMLTKAFMKDNLRLGDLLSEEDYGVVKDHFEEMGLPMIFLDRIKPLFLSVFAGGDLDPMSLQSGDFLSYELELSEKAENQGKETGGLESIDYQLSLFDSIPYKDQAVMLVESIKTSSESDGMLEELTRQYTSQDLKQMHDYTLKEESGMMDHAEILLYDRNSNWIPVMREFMKNEPVLFAVGAGHLGGHKGVLALLRSQGFEVTPLK
jgi:uncharacterized protein YbaP (TraB family)